MCEQMSSFDSQSPRLSKQGEKNKQTNYRDIINSLLKTGNKTANINVKNCSLYTLLTATDRKPQKS